MFFKKKKNLTADFSQSATSAFGIVSHVPLLDDTGQVVSHAYVVKAPFDAKIGFYQSTLVIKDAKEWDDFWRSKTGGNPPFGLPDKSIAACVVEFTRGETVDVSVEKLSLSADGGARIDWSSTHAKTEETSKGCFTVVVLPDVNTELLEQHYTYKSIEACPKPSTWVDSIRKPGK